MDSKIIQNFYSSFKNAQFGSNLKIIWNILKWQTEKAYNPTKPKSAKTVACNRHVHAWRGKDAHHARDSPRSNFRFSNIRQQCPQYRCHSAGIIFTGPGFTFKQSGHWRHNNCSFYQEAMTHAPHQQPFPILPDQLSESLMPQTGREKSYWARNYRL